MNSKRTARTLGALLLAAGFSLAHASGVTPVGNNGNLTLATSNADSSVDFNNGLATPGTYDYGDSFGSSSANQMFYDSFIITVMPGQLDAITTTINVPLGGSNGLGITGLESRLFSFTPGAGIPIPTNSAPASGTLINSWTNIVIPSGQSTGYVNVLSDPSISQGTYVLQIEGTPMSSGGSYGGSVNLSAVPLPSTVFLFPFGLLIIALSSRKRPRVSTHWTSPNAG